VSFTLKSVLRALGSADAGALAGALRKRSNGDAAGAAATSVSS
jgi:hypothetical protein